MPSTLIDKLVNPVKVSTHPGVLANFDVLGGHGGKGVEVFSVTAPHHGRVEIGPSGKLVFRPAIAFIKGTDAFTVTVTDGAKMKNIKVTVTMSGAPASPTPPPSPAPGVPADSGSGAAPGDGGTGTVPDTGTGTPPDTGTGTGTPPDTGTGPGPVDPGTDPEPPVDLPEGWTELWRGEILPEEIGQTAFQFLGRSNARWSFFEDVHNKLLPPHMPGAERFRIGTAPDGTPAMDILIPEGAVVNYLAVSSVVPEGVGHALFEGQIFVPQGFVWPPDGGQKIGVAGVFIGGTSSKIGGGVLPKDQTGIAIRNVHGGKFGLRLYDYDLDRKGKPGTDPKTAQLFGRVGLKPSGALPKGRWVKVAYEVKMDTGHNDGLIRFLVDDRLVETVTGLDLGFTRGFRLRGFLFNDMWGGNEDDDINLNKAGPQHYWFAKHRILVPG